MGGKNANLSRGLDSREIVEEYSCLKIPPCLKSKRTRKKNKREQSHV